MMEESYTADGWLGMMIAGKLYYPFFGETATDNSKLATRVDEVARELGERGKLKNPASAAPPAQPAQQKTMSPPSKPTPLPLPPPPPSASPTAALPGMPAITLQQDSDLRVRRLSLLLQKIEKMEIQGHITAEEAGAMSDCVLDLEDTATTRAVHADSVLVHAQKLVSATDNGRVISRQLKRQLLGS